MSQEVVRDLANGTMKLSVSGGVASSILDFFNVNAAGLGVMVSLLGVIVATFFYYLNWKKASKADDNQRQIHELKEQLNGLSERKNKRELTE